MKFNDRLCIKRQMLLPLAAVVAAGIFGAGGSCLGPPGGSGGSGGTGGPTVNVAYRNFLLATNKTDDTLTVFAISADTGLLTKLSTVATGHQPADVIVPRLNSTALLVVYVLNGGDRTISEFQMFRDGTLKSLSPATIPVGSNPVAFVHSTALDSVSVVDKGANAILNYSIQTNGQMTSAGETATGPGPVVAALLFGELCEVNSGNNTLWDFISTGSSLQLPSKPTATYQVGHGAADVTCEQGPNQPGAVWVANNSDQSITSLPTSWDISGNGPSRITGSGSITPIVGHPVAITTDIYVGTKNGDRAVYVLTQEGQLLQYGLTGDDTVPVPARATAVATGPSPTALLPTSLALGKPFVYVANSGDGTVWQYTVHGDFSAPSVTGAPVVSGKGVDALATALTSGLTALAPGSGGILVPIKSLDYQV